MNPVTILELIVLIAIIIVSILIIRWIMKRYKICGATDPLCYVTGRPTTATSIIADIF